MSIPAKVAAYLNKAKVPFEVVVHRTVFTAYDLAATLREKLETIGKTLLIKTETGFLLVVMPANRRLDLAKLKAVLGAKKISIATEKDMVNSLKVKAGAITPFGALHKLGVVVDTSLLKTQKILLGAGSFTESLRLKAKDFVKTEEARVAAFTTAADLPNPVVPKKQPKKKKAKRPSRRPLRGSVKKQAKPFQKRRKAKIRKKK